MRLIDANDVKKRGDCYPPDIRETIANILSHTKTVKDAVCVVRCKDCIHKDVPCTLYGGSQFFCAYGERGEANDSR